MGCLVLSQEEKSRYKKFGVPLFEVQRDFLETGLVRSPNAILNKIKLRENGSTKVTSTKELDSVLSDKATVWLNLMSKALGVESKMISVETAKEIHASKNKQYSGETAFFADNVVYFIENTLTAESAVHEFSHPLIKSLPQELRDALYKELLETEAGKDIEQTVKALYQGEFDSLQEEVLVRALTNEMLKDSSFFQNLMYAIKQMLRKVIGKKVNVSKLTPTHTLKDLADMLKSGDVLDLQDGYVSDSDVIDYYKNVDAFIDNFNMSLEDRTNDDRAKSLQQAIDSIYNVASYYIDNIQSEKSDLPDSLKELLVDEFDQGMLQDVMKTLGDSAYRTNDLLIALHVRDKGALVNSAQEVKNKLTALANSLIKISDMMDSVNNTLSEIDKLDSKEKIDTILSYRNFLSEWNTIFDEIASHNRWSTSSGEVFDLYTKLEKAKNIAENKMNELAVDAAVDVVYEMLTPVIEKAKKQFQEELAKAKKSNSQVLIDNLYYDYHNMSEPEYKRFEELKARVNTLSREEQAQYNTLNEKWLYQSLDVPKSKLKAMLDGEAKDASWLQGMLESVSMSTDPMVATVAQFIKKQKSIYQVLAVNSFNEMTRELDEYKDDFQNLTHGELGKKLGFRDQTSQIDPETGDVQVKEEWSFLNEWKNYRFDDAVHKDKIKKLALDYQNTNSPETKKKWLNAKHEYQVWKNTYMNQKYDASYYEADMLLTKDDLGHEASEQMEEIFEQVLALENDNDGGRHDDAIQQLEHQRKMLSSSFDELGVKKTGLALEVAERLQEHKKAKAGFTTEEEVPNLFQNAYTDYHNEIIASGVAKDSDVYKLKMEAWLRENTRVVMKSSVMDKQAKLIDEKKVLLQELKEYNKQLQDTTDAERLILDAKNMIKDSGVQPDGTQASKELRDAVKKAHEELEQAKQKHVTPSGLTAEESKRYSYLLSLKKAGKPWENSSDEMEFFDLTGKKALVQQQTGISASVSKRLAEINKELHKSSKDVTSYYKDVIVKLINDQNQAQEFIDYLGEEDIVVSSMEEADANEFLFFLNSDKGKDLMSRNADLKSWYEQNHYESEDEEMQPTDLWIKTVSEDPFDHKTKMLRDENGKKIGLIKIDGVYRVPSYEYYASSVKDEFVTEKVVGKTVDNKGNYLPKFESTNRYRNHDYYDLEQNDPRAFEMLKVFKKHYLKIQENATDNDKLYLTFPKERKKRIENWKTGNVFQIGRRLREYFIAAPDDAIDYKTVSDLNSHMVHSSGMLLDQSRVNAPVLGTFDLNIKDVSTDLFSSIGTYTASLMQKQALNEAVGVSKVIRDVASKTNVVERHQGKSVIKQMYGSVANFIKVKSGNKENASDNRELSNRYKIIDMLVQKEIDGVNTVGFAAKSRLFNKGMSSLNKISSRQNFTFSFVSDTVNVLQAKIEAFTGAVAGEDINLVSGAVGEMWAVKASRKMTKTLRLRGEKTFEEKLVNLFDMSNGRTDETLGDNYSRTMIGDLLQGNLSTSYRRFGELSVMLHNFGSLMYQRKVKVTVNGQTKIIPYLKAFELVDNRIQTIPGVESKYEVRYDEEGKLVAGEGFQEQKNLNHNVALKWNGAFSKEDSPLIDRFALAKAALFLRKYLIPLYSKHAAFTTGSRRNYGLPIKRRMNWTTGRYEYGYTVSTLKTIANFFRVGPIKGAQGITAFEVKSVIITLTKILIGEMLLPIVSGLLIPKSGDDDDDDKNDDDKIDYAQMNNRSGWLEVPGLSADQEFYEFNPNGFLMNTAAYVTFKTTSEFNQSNLLTPAGLKGVMTLPNAPMSIAYNQVSRNISTALEIASDDITQGKNQSKGSFFYQQDEYKYGKLIDLLAKTGFGFDDKNYNPVEGIRATEKNLRFK